MTTPRPDDGTLDVTQPFQTDDMDPAGQASPPTDIDMRGEIGAAPPAEPVGTPRRAGGLRWGIALGAVAVAVGVLAAGAFLLTGQAPTSRLAGWAPVGATAYGEVRLDLPGDQRARLGEFLAHFPGFADQAILDDKIDEALDRIVSGATEGRQDFTNDIKPWFDGQLALAVEARSVAVGSAHEHGQGLALVAITDRAAARAWFEGIAAEAGMTLWVEQHGTTDLLVDPDGKAAVAFADGVMLAGDRDSVTAALDTGGRSGLPESPTFAAARAAMPGDRLAFGFVDVDGAMAALESAAPVEMFALPLDGTMRELLPDWMAMGLRVEDDAMVVEAAWPHVERAGFPTTNRVGALAAHVPASTILLTDARSVGEMLAAAIERARQDPEAAAGLAEIEQAAALLGGLDALVGWIGDAGLVVTSDGTDIGGGLVVVPADAAGAQRIATQLGSFLALFGAESGLEVRTEQHAGATITIVDLGDLGSLLGGAIGGGGLDGMPVAPVDEATSIEIAWTVTDDVVVLALGPDFVRSVLDVSPGTSLADDPRYRALLDAVGRENAGSMFVDLGAARVLVERLIATEGGTAATEYERDVKPYVEAFDAWVQAIVLGDEVDRAIMRVTVD